MNFLWPESFFFFRSEQLVKTVTHFMTTKCDFLLVNPSLIGWFLLYTYPTPRLVFLFLLQTPTFAEINRVSFRLGFLGTNFECISIKKKKTSLLTRQKKMTFYEVISILNMSSPTSCRLYSWKLIDYNDKTAINILPTWEISSALGV